MWDDLARGKNKKTQIEHQTTEQDGPNNFMTGEEQENA